MDKPLIIQFYGYVKGQPDAHPQWQNWFTGQPVPKRPMSWRVVNREGKEEARGTLDQCIAYRQNALSA